MTSGDEYLQRLHILREHEQRKKKGMSIKEYLEEIKDISRDFPVKGRGAGQSPR